jgi:predicted transposase YdaD
MSDAKREGEALGMKKGREEGKKEGLEEGREKGKKEGLEEGREKGRKEIALTCLKKGLSLKDVEELTGLATEEILALQKKTES